MSAEDPEVSLVVPAFDEEGNISILCENRLTVSRNRHPFARPAK